ncbi:hypothetical protein U1Q18_010657 [Sarracenia purpurea var. burkii]
MLVFAGNVLLLRIGLVLSLIWLCYVWLSWGICIGSVLDCSSHYGAFAIAIWMHLLATKWCVALGFCYGLLALPAMLPCFARPFCYGWCPALMLLLLWVIADMLCQSSQHLKGFWLRVCCMIITAMVDMVCCMIILHELICMEVCCINKWCMDIIDMVCGYGLTAMVDALHEH